MLPREVLMIKGVTGKPGRDGDWKPVRLLCDLVRTGLQIIDF